VEDAQCAEPLRHPAEGSLADGVERHRVVAVRARVQQREAHRLGAVERRERTSAGGSFIRRSATPRSDASDRGVALFAVESCRCEMSGSAEIGV
jgi:hypothetical protein